jgi:dihydroflavonol-4-reductase
MKEKVLVTGADGMLGSNLVRELLAREYMVRALIQTGRNAKTLRGLSVELVFGDILNLCDVEKAMEDCDYVIHAAASTSIWPARNRMVYDINLEGTMNIVWTSTKQKIKRLVHISSAAVFNAGSCNAPGDETGSFTNHRFGLDYIDSKYDAQKLVMKAVHCGLNAIIVNPTFMLGAYDSPFGSNSMILAICNRKIFANPPGGKNFICAKDVAFATCNALVMGKTGECYILGNENLTYREFFRLTAEVVNQGEPIVSLSAPWMKLFGKISNTVAALFGKKPFISMPMARLSCEQQFFTAKKAICDLQLPQTPIAVGIQEAYAWYKENGFTK